ncbi:MAG: bis(5'-nucleosyl)-tetraphosphatase (symmetrical) YqeK [Candidatus Hydrogenedentota bacterium]
MDYKVLKQRLKRELSEELYRHSLGVSKTARNLARKHHINEDKAYISGLLHDCARDFNKEELRELIKKHKIRLDKYEQNISSVWHSIVGSVLAKKVYGIKDRDILKAIREHTTGSNRPGDLSILIYISDFIEPGRKFDSLEELRKLSSKDLYKTAYLTINKKMKHIKKKGKTIHPATLNFRKYIENRLK